MKEQNYIYHYNSNKEYFVFKLNIIVTRKQMSKIKPLDDKSTVNKALACIINLTLQFTQNISLMRLICKGISFQERLISAS